MAKVKVFDPDVQWIIIHHRATDTIMFGPWPSLDAASEWAAANSVMSYPQPLLPPRVADGGYTTLWEGWDYTT